MKTRNGFVSNSSSSSFILDLRKEGVRELVDKIIAREPTGLDRCTAKAIGRDAVEYAKEWIEVIGELVNDNSSYGIGHWILEWANKLGEDNIVFVRESDEGSGGYLFDNNAGRMAEEGDDMEFEKGYEELERLKEDEREYH